mgnify:CR=1 FL=1
MLSAHFRYEIRTVLADPIHSLADEDATILADPAGMGRSYAVSAGMATLDDIGTSTVVQTSAAQPPVPPPPPPGVPGMAPPPPPPPPPVMVVQDESERSTPKIVAGVVAAISSQRCNDKGTGCTVADGEPREDARRGAHKLEQASRVISRRRLSSERCRLGVLAQPLGQHEVRGELDSR